MFEIESEILALLRKSSEKLKEYFGFTDIPEITLDVPRDTKFGDLASSIALKIGRQIKHPATELAHIMADYMKPIIKEPPLNSIVKDVVVSAPGFINFFVKKEALYYILGDIKKSGADFGRNDLGKREKLNIEFVSANPTGPLTVAHGRQAAFGDSLARILEFSGFKVKREYYVNDEGRQIMLLGQSIRARYLELIGQVIEFPKDGYHGEYITEIAQSIKNRFSSRKLRAKAKFFEDYGYKTIMKEIKVDLIKFGVKFDTFYSQKSLRTSGKIKKAFSILEKNNFLYKHEGALWLKSSAFGDEKDRVVVKSDKSYTYLGPDIAYHMDKLKRRFNVLIDIWGPDHHGYIARIKAAIAGLGFNNEKLSVLIVQLVSLFRGKSPMRMSTRAGSFVTLKEIVSEIGLDCTRYFFLRRRRDSHLDFDLELAKKHTLDNPVYYIQYAHARISSILKYEKSNSKAPKTSADLNLLKEKEEARILTLLRSFGLVVQRSAEGYEPYGLLSYLEELAKAFHSFYNKHRVVSEDASLTKSRLLLAECIKIVIANGLRLLGVNAPTQM